MAGLWLLDLGPRMKYPQKKYPQEKYPQEKYPQEKYPQGQLRRWNDVLHTVPQSEQDDWERGDRVFYKDGEWFFQTRERIDVGPYKSQFEAEVEAGLLKELLAGVTDANRLEAIVRGFVIDSQPVGGPRLCAYSNSRLVGSA